MKRFPSYDAALDWLYSFIDYEKRRNASYDPENYNLERMRHLLSRAGYSQDFKVVHVAGTKGKGSTSTAVALFFRTCGRTGLFTSPHLIDVRERISINGKMISRGAFIRILSGLAAVVDTLPPDLTPTTFELFTAAALMHFKNERVSWAVLEVGMGGRLDSTNVVSPEATVITSISFDHMDKLGSTLGAIAGEKAGIIKHRVPVISARQHAEARNVIERAAHEHEAPVMFFGDEGFRSSLDALSFKGTAFTYHTRGGKALTVSTPLIGEFQMENISLALKTAETVLAPEDTGMKRIIRTARRISFRGRFDVVSRKPLCIVDGAHNRDSMEKLVATIRTLAPHDTFAVLFAPLMDKDIDGMLDALHGFAASIIVSAPRSHKSADASFTAAKARAKGFVCEEIADFNEALKHFRTLLRTQSGLVTGSLYAVSSFYSRK